MTRRPRRAQARGTPAVLYPWGAFAVHFVLGGLLGAAMGFGLFVYSSPKGLEGATREQLAAALAITLVLALPAGYFRGRFWQSLGRRNRCSRPR